MMIRLYCPLCSKDSYSTSIYDFRPCPYCGISFSGKYGREKRTEKRSKKQIPFLILWNGTNIRAHTKDISSQGLGVTILDRASLVSGDTINLKIGKSYVMLEVVWVRNKENISLSAGLKLRYGTLSSS